MQREREKREREKKEREGAREGGLRLSCPLISNVAHSLPASPPGLGRRPCLRAMEPPHHPNLLIVGAKLAHGGFLLEPLHIKQTENAEKAKVAPCSPYPILSLTP